MINTDLIWFCFSPQAFNAYKIQRQKEEREEARMRQKKAKEDFEDFLVNKVTSCKHFYLIF